MRPNNPYTAASKAAVDLLGIQHYLAHGTDVVIVRPFNHAGPRQSPRYVLASLALHVAEVERGEREYLEVGNLDVIRDFVDVRDVVHFSTVAWHVVDKVVRFTILAEEKAPRLLMHSSIFALRLIGKFQCASTVLGCVQLTNPCSFLMPPSSVAP